MNDPASILIVAVSVFLSFILLPAAITFIIDLLLKRAIKNKKVRIALACLVFILSVIILIAAHGVYIKKS